MYNNTIIIGNQAQSNIIPNADEGPINALPSDILCVILVDNLKCAHQTALVNKRWNHIVAPHMLLREIPITICAVPDWYKVTFQVPNIPKYKNFDDRVDQLLYALFSKGNLNKTLQALTFLVNNSTGFLYNRRSLRNLSPEICKACIKQGYIESAVKVGLLMPIVDRCDNKSSLVLIVETLLDKGNIEAAIDIANAMREEDGEKNGWAGEQKQLAYHTIITRLIANNVDIKKALQLVFMMPGVPFYGTSLSGPRLFVWALGDIKDALIKLASQDIDQVISMICELKVGEMNSEAALEKYKNYLFHAVALNCATREDFKAADRIIKIIPGDKTSIIKSVQDIKEEKEKEKSTTCSIC